jgi:hypothetical protein
MTAILTPPPSIHPPATGHRLHQAATFTAPSAPPPGQRKVRIHRTDKHRPGCSFTRIDNTILTDPRLGFIEKGIMAQLLQLPDDYRCAKKRIQRCGAKIGRASFDKAWTRLAACGYVRLCAERTDGRPIKFWTVHECPVPPDPATLAAIASATAERTVRRKCSDPATSGTESGNAGFPTHPKTVIYNNDEGLRTNLPPPPCTVVSAPPVPAPSPAKVVDGGSGRQQKADPAPPHRQAPPAPPAASPAPADDWHRLLDAFGQTSAESATEAAKRDFAAKPFTVDADDAKLVRHHQTATLDERAERAGGKCLTLHRFVATWPDQVRRAKEFAKRVPPPKPKLTVREDRPPVPDWQVIAAGLGYTERTTESAWRNLAHSTRAEIWDAHESGELPEAPAPAAVGLLAGFLALLKPADGEVDGLAG